jgi:hypothetical protein
VTNHHDRDGPIRTWGSCGGVSPVLALACWIGERWLPIDLAAFYRDAAR